MAEVSSPLNTEGERLDSIELSTGPTGLLKRAVAGSSRAVTGGDVNAAAQEVGTDIDRATFSAGTATVLSFAGYALGTAAGTVTSGQLGAVRMDFDRVLVTRETGLTGTRVTHAINITTGTTSIGTALSSGRRSIDVYNGGTSIVYLGSSAVSTAIGMPLGTGGYYFEQGNTDLYATTTGGTAVLRVQERA